jgi:hypothetical protein
MRSDITFDREMKIFLSSHQSELIQYFNSEYRKSRIKSYLCFFEEFLLDYGVMSILAIPLTDHSSYLPIINFRFHNIFNMPEGDLKLNETGLNLAASEKALANFLISKLSKMTAMNFNNFDKK